MNLSELASTPEFQDWQWTLTNRIRDGIEAVYATDPDEIKCIDAMVKAIQGTQPIRSPNLPGISVSCEGAFLHGSNSQVRFRVGGVKKQCELADILVLGSYIEDNSLKWQRACFIQAKRGTKPSDNRQTRFSIDKWQLTLLRAFPTFYGISGIFQGINLHLRNRSGMLGAYGLLTDPGEFTVISARILSQILGGRKSITNKEIVPALLSEINSSKSNILTNSAHPWELDPKNCATCRWIVNKLMSDLGYNIMHEHPQRSYIEDNEESQLTCLGLDELVQAWSLLRLGEIWRTGVRVKSDINLGISIRILISKVHKATGNLRMIKEIMENVNFEEFSNDQRSERGRDEYSDGSGCAILSAVFSSHTEME